MKWQSAHEQQRGEAQRALWTGRLHRFTLVEVPDSHRQRQPWFRLAELRDRFSRYHWQ